MAFTKRWDSFKSFFLKITEPLKKLDSSDRIAAIALITSFFSIFFSVFQFRETQEQFRIQQKEDSVQFNISIRPQIAIETATGNYDSYSGVFISNVGLGPARLIRMRIFYKKSECNSFETLWHKIKADHPDIFKTNEFYIWRLIDSKFTLIPNRKIWVLFTKNETINNPAMLEKVFLKDMRIDIEYASFTGKTFTQSWVPIE